MNKKMIGEDSGEERLYGGTIWLNAKVLGLVLGFLFGFAVFVATIWLVLKGGRRVGPHLILLSQFFIGYRVSVLGSFIGFAYGFALGTLGGTMIGWIYNKIVDLKNNHS